MYGRPFGLMINYLIIIDLTTKITSGLWITSDA